MLASYPAIYRDKYGEDATVIYNDGKTLRLEIRGIEFSGSAFDMLEPPANCDAALLGQFNFFLDALYACEMECSIPVYVVDGGQILEGALRVYIELGYPTESRPMRMIRIKKDRSQIQTDTAPSREVLRLELVFGGNIFKSQGKNLYSAFDEQLSEIQAQLTVGVYLKTCWNCAFSDYHPVGSGTFGGLACFRNTKDEYRKIRDKRALMLLWDKRAEYVQEVYLCSEFEKRQPGVGGLYVG